MNIDEVNVEDKSISSFEITPSKTKQGKTKRVLANECESDEKKNMTPHFKTGNESGKKMKPHLTLDISTIKTSSSYQNVEEQEQANKLAKCDAELSFVLPFLCVGSKTVASNKQMLLDAGITHIINCAANIYPNYFPETFYYIALSLTDDPQEDLLSLFPFLVSTIENIRKSPYVGIVSETPSKKEIKKKINVIFIHCHQGVSRSSTVVIAYLMWAFLINPETSIRILKKKRGIVRPNYGFVGQLHEWGLRIKGGLNSSFILINNIISNIKENANKKLIGTIFPPLLYRMCAQHNLNEESVISPHAVTYPWKINLFDKRFCYVLWDRMNVYVWMGRNSHQFIRDGSVAFAKDLIYYFTPPPSAFLSSSAAAYLKSSVNNSSSLVDNASSSFSPSSSPPSSSPKWNNSKIVHNYSSANIPISPLTECLSSSTFSCPSRSFTSSSPGLKPNFLSNLRNNKKNKSSYQLQPTSAHRKNLSLSFKTTQSLNLLNKNSISDGCAVNASFLSSYAKLLLKWMNNTNNHNSISEFISNPLNYCYMSPFTSPKEAARPIELNSPPSAYHSSLSCGSPIDYSFVHTPSSCNLPLTMRKDVDTIDELEELFINHTPISLSPFNDHSLCPHPSGSEEKDRVWKEGKLMDEASSFATPSVSKLRNEPYSSPFAVPSTGKGRSGSLPLKSDFFCDEIPVASSSCVVSPVVNDLVTDDAMSRSLIFPEHLCDGQQVADQFGRSPPIVTLTHSISNDAMSRSLIFPEHLSDGQQVADQFGPSPGRSPPIVTLIHSISKPLPVELPHNHHFKSSSLPNSSLSVPRIALRNLFVPLQTNGVVSTNVLNKKLDGDMLSLSPTSSLSLSSSPSSSLSQVSSSCSSSLLFPSTSCSSSSSQVSSSCSSSLLFPSTSCSSPPVLASPSSLFRPSLSLEQLKERNLKMGKERELQEEGNIERNEKVDKRNEEEITEGKINEEREEKMDVEKEELPNQERKRKFRIVKRKKKKGNKKMMVERVQEMNRLIGDDEFNTRREKAEDEPALPLPAVVVSNHRNVSNVDLIKDESNTDDLVEDGVSGTVQVNLPMDIHMKSNVGTIQVDLPLGLCVKGGGAMSIGYKDNNLLEKQSNGTIQVGFPVGLCVKGGGVMSIGCNDNNLLEKQSNKSLDFLSTKPEILISDLLKSFSSLSSCEDEVRVNESLSCINEENVEVKKREEKRGREKEGVGNESSNYINEENVEVKKREENRGREKEGVGNELSSCINEENVEVGEKEERRGREKEGVGSKNKGKNVYFPIFESSPFNSTDSSRLAMSVPNSPLIQKVSSNITSPLFSPSNRSDLPMSPLLDKSDLCAFPSRLSSPLGNTINFPLFPTNKTGEVVLKVFVQGESNEREFWNAIEQAYELTKDVLSSRETTLFTRAQTPTPSSSSRSSSSSFTPLFSLLPGTPHLLRSAAASPLTICDDAFDYKSILDNEAADYDVDANAKLSPYIFTPPSSLTAFSNNVNDSEMERNDMGGWRELEEGVDKKMDF